MQPIYQNTLPLLGYVSPTEQPAEEEIPLGLLALVAKQQEDAQQVQVAQSPMLDALGGIGGVGNREMSVTNFMANLFGSGAYTGLLSPLMPTVSAKIASGAAPITYNQPANEVQQVVNQRIRSMSPEEYERFAVYS